MAKKISNVSVEDKPSTDTLSYTGNVTLKLQKGKHIVKTVNIKNTATMRMFEGIAYMLINGFSIDLEPFTPHYLAVAYSESTPTATNVTDTDLSVGIENAVTARLIASNIFQSESSWVAPFSAVISYQALNLFNGKVNELGLFATNNSKTMLARIVLDPEDEIVVQAGMNLIVEWNIYIQNK